MKLPVKSVIPVGAPDPELKTSPVFDHDSEETDYADLELEEGACYYNGKRYAIGQYVSSGDELLHCTGRGVWVRKGVAHR
jgi:hypothetical protein